MNKLKLDIDSLEVETFGADPGEGEQGTVYGNATLNTCQGPMCGPYTSIDYGCRYLTAAYDCCAPDYSDDEYMCRRLVEPTEYCSATTE